MIREITAFDLRENNAINRAVRALHIRTCITPVSRMHPRYFAIVSRRDADGAPCERRNLLRDGWITGLRNYVAGRRVFKKSRVRTPGSPGEHLRLRDPFPRPFVTHETSARCAYVRAYVSRLLLSFSFSLFSPPVTLSPSRFQAR